ncbi:MAG: ROK family protein [Gemmatimonadetes bacterium]|nr:ROK family protein [Gemmatimonadota bacterium]
MRVIIGVDLGGTNIVVGAVPEDGSRVYALASERTPVQQGAEAVVQVIVRMIGACVEGTRREAPGAEVAGVGVGAPGPLDTKRGIVIFAPNLTWRNMPLRDRIADAVQLPSTLDNDANCAVFGEWWQGAARGARFVVGLTIGTGVGGGIVLDGQLFHGASDVAGEIGHTSIDLNGRRCKCGNYGCIEAYASGPAIAARAVEGLQAGATSKLAQYVNGDLKAIDAQVVYRASHDGDDFAKEVVRDTARFLGATIASVVNLLNPEVVVICGGVTLAGEQLFAPLREEVRRRAFEPAVAACRIVPGALTGTAGVYGAAATFKVQRWGQV